MPTFPVLSSLSLSFRLGRLARLARKELTETLRDRRTIATLVLMPLLLYPLLTIAFRAFYVGGTPAEVAARYRLGFNNEQQSTRLLNFLYSGLDETSPDLRPGVYTDLEEEVRQGRVDLGFRCQAEKSDPLGVLACDWEVLYREDSHYSREALVALQRLCSKANARFLSERLRKVGLPQRSEPIRLIPAGMETKKKQLPMAVFVPLVLILMTITGAVYPAIDVTAGERERGTLEVLVAAPIPRVSLLFGKYVAVVTVALLTGVVNIVAMSLSVLLSGQGKAVFGPSGFSFLILVEIFGLVLLFAAFFSAVLLVVTSFARSFKEAQAYLVPLMLASLTPGLLTLMPSVQLTNTLAMVPLLNIVLLARDLLEGQALPWPAVIVVISTAGYAFLAVAAAARLFGGEAVLYTEYGNWRKLFRRKTKRPSRTNDRIPNDPSRTNDQIPNDPY